MDEAEREGCVRRARHTIRIFAWQLDSMDEYTVTLPTGTTPFKMWKTRVRQKWMVGQYYPIDVPGQVGIRWFRVVYLEGPMPPGWRPPDWSNYERFRRERKAERAAGFPRHGGSRG